MLAEDEKREAKWMERILPLANRIARARATNPRHATDMAQDALMHVILLNRRYPKLRLMENEGYTYRCLENKIRDWRKVEKRRTTRLQPLNEEPSENDDRHGEHPLHQTLEPVFDDEHMTDFMDREWLIRVYHVLRPKLTAKPRRLLGAIYKLDTRDPAVLAMATGIRDADAVRANLSIIRRTAKKLKLLEFSE